MRSYTIVAAAALMTGCVTQGTYDQLQARHDALAGSLAEREGENADLRGRLANEQKRGEELEGEVRKKEAELAALVKDKSALQSSVEEMQRALAELQKRKAEADARIAEFRALLDKFKGLIDAGKLKVKISDGRMIVSLASDVLFAPGAANLSKDGKAAVQEVAQLLASIADRKFQVEGHTDNVPISTPIFPSNWELGSARALTVVKTMIDAGLPADRVSAASYGDARPARPNDSAEGKAANRRIEIVVVPDLSTLPGFDELQKVGG